MKLINHLSIAAATLAASTALAVAAPVIIQSHTGTLGSIVYDGGGNAISFEVDGYEVDIDVPNGRFTDLLDRLDGEEVEFTDHDSDGYFDYTDDGNSDNDDTIEKVPGDAGGPSRV